MVGFVLLLSACTVGGGTPVTLNHVVVPTIKGGGSFDVIEIDQQAHRMFVADRSDTGIDVFDTYTSPATYLKTISLASSPNGLALATDLKRLFVGLTDGDVAFIDDQETAVKLVPTGGKTVDLIDYSPAAHQVYAANSSEGSVTTIDATAGTVINAIKLGAVSLEQPRYNPADNTLYVMSPSADVLFAVDPITARVKRKIDLAGCHGKGLAINPARDQAMIACGAYALRLNLRNTNDQESFTAVDGGDVVTYDAKADRYLVAMPDRIPSAVAVLGGSPIKYIAMVATRSGGNSAALDEGNLLVYTPDQAVGNVGLVAFNLPEGEPPISFDQSALVELGVVVGIVVLAMLVIGRLADPIRRPELLPAPRRRRV